jgi:hypothetical protein
MTSGVGVPVGSGRRYAPGPGVPLEVGDLGVGIPMGARPGRLPRHGHGRRRGEGLGGPKGRQF